MTPPTKTDDRDLRGVVYMIRNVVNGKVYFGQTLRSFNARYSVTAKRHWTESKSISRYLQKAVVKYGPDAFEVVILDHGKTRAQLNELERFYIQSHRSDERPFGYNLQAGGLYFNLGKQEIERRAKRFVERAVKRHGDSYDYSHAQFKDTKTKVEIWCKRCNQPFLQQPMAHMRGCGCPSCGDVKTGEGLRLPTEEVLQRLESKYGNSFSFELPEHRNTRGYAIRSCKSCGHHRKLTLSRLLHSSAATACPICIADPVCQVDAKTGAILHWFKTLQLAADSVGTTTSQIGRAANGRRATCYGFAWKWADTQSEVVA